MTQLDLLNTGNPFDALCHVEADGSERWYGRELMPVMDYSRWERFAAVITKAKASLALVQGADAAEHHFPTWGSDGGRWQGDKVADFRLTRFAAYLTAMAGDDTKDAIARARVYFAVQTRKAEVAAAPTPVEPKLSELDAARKYVAALEREAALVIRVAELEPAAENWEQIQGGDGINLKTFRKKYFVKVPERAFFEHLYARGYLIDQRGTGGWSERRQKHRDGWQHRHPAAKGEAFMFLHTDNDRQGERRQSVRVLSGEPELAFKAALIRDGLTPTVISPTLEIEA